MEPIIKVLDRIVEVMGNWFSPAEVGFLPATN